MKDAIRTGDAALRPGGGDFTRVMHPAGPGRPGRIEKARDPRHALKRLLPYLDPFRRRLLTVLALVLTYTLLGLAGPYLMGVAIDRFISTKTAGGLARIALAMLTAYILWNLFQVLAAAIMAAVSQGALKQLRRDLFSHLQALPVPFFDRIPAGELMSRLTNDIDAIDQAVSQNVLTLLAGVLSLAGILVAMFILDFWLALMPLTGVLGNLFVIVLAGLGGWLALQGLVSVGIIATFINYGQNFIQPLRQMANVYNAVQAALAGAERVFEILDIPPEADDAAADAPRERPFRGALRFEDVSFGYVPGFPVINNMSLDVEAGRMIALVGPTGAGKTTVINLLMRFYEVDSGRITIDGTDIRALPKARLRRRIGLVLQDTFLFSATVMENIRYGRLDASDDA